MPYKSQAQRRAFLALLRRGEINPAVVAEYEGKSVAQVRAQYAVGKRKGKKGGR